MRALFLILMMGSGAALMGCATSLPIDTPPDSFPTSEELTKREAAAAIKCNSDGPKPIQRLVAAIPPRAFDVGRSGNVKFIFDLDDAGGITNLKIREATEDIFLEPTLKALKTWQYPELIAGELPGTRQNICAGMSFFIQDDRGRRNPTWLDIEANNKT